MTAAENMPADRPAIRKGQCWLYKGQTWRVHDVLTEGVIVLMGPHIQRQLEGVTAEELYECGELREEAPDPRRLGKLTKLIEEAAAKAAKPKRPKKPKPPPAPRPWRCTILAVDTANNSGWSLWIDGELQDYGEVRKDDDVALLGLCERARSSLPCVMVMEASQGIAYRNRSMAVLIGLGAAREAWERAWRDAGGLKGRIVRVKPTRWRGALFGGGMRGLLGQRKKTRDVEQEYALLTLREHCLAAPPANDNGHVVLGGDAAAAICIGRWAACAGEVGAALPRKVRLYA